MFSEFNSLFIVGIYRPPSAPLNDALTRIADAMDKISLGNNNLICLVGDLNVNSLDKLDNNSIRLQEFLASYDIQRLDLPPTRITPDSASSIDAVCTNIDESKIKVEIMHSFLSDHTGQHCTLIIPSTVQQASYSTHRQFSTRNLSNLKYKLVELDWGKVFRASDAQTAYSYFINILTFAMDCSCPYKTSRKMPKGSSKTVFLSPEVNRLRKQFIEAQEKYNLSGREEDRCESSLRKKAYDLKLKALKRQANESIIEESSNRSKTIWRIINGERASRKDIGEMKWQLNVSGQAVEDINDVVECFNIYFTSAAGEILKTNDALKTTIATTLNPFQPEHILTDFQPTNCQEIFIIIDKLKTSFSAGFDDVNSKMLKFCAEELCPALTYIINKSLTEGVFPAEFKISKVYPLHKQGNKDEVKNFRPISLLSSIAKVMERVVLARLIQHIDRNNLMPVGQHGFLPGRSTITALVELVEKIIDHLDKGNTVSSMFLDLSKAFDCLDHNLILTKLDNMGIKGTALKWFKDYLSGRTQIVEVNKARSSPLDIKRVVPQGSVLGPVLFVLFTCDFPNFMAPYSHVVMFADDSVLLTYGRAAEALEISSFISVNMAHEYCINNDLVFNENKTNQVIFGRLRDLISGLPNIEMVESTKHLGVMLDNRLSWNDHIDSLCLRLHTSLFVLRRINTVSTRAATIIAYHALFEAHIRYGVILWGGSSNNNLSRVLTIQKYALRIITGLKQQDSCRQVFKELKILTVTSIYIIEVIMYACGQRLARNSDIHTIQTRHAHDFSLPAHRMALFAKKPSYAGAKLYNLLPMKLKNGNFSTLKRRLKTWLLDESIYSLEEFAACSENYQTT